MTGKGVEAKEGIEAAEVKRVKKLNKSTDIILISFDLVGINIINT
jgi:hypothetical protein